jgi:hypothetical protein
VTITLRQPGIFPARTSQPLLTALIRGVHGQRAPPLLTFPADALRPHPRTLEVDQRVRGRPPVRNPR